MSRRHGKQRRATARHGKRLAVSVSRRSRSSVPPKIPNPRLQQPRRQILAEEFPQKKISGGIHRKQWWHPEPASLQIWQSAGKARNPSNGSATPRTLERTSPATGKFPCFLLSRPARTVSLWRDIHPRSPEPCRILPAASDSPRISPISRIVGGSWSSPSLAGIACG